MSKINHIKVLSLFSGIGAYEKALKNIGVIPDIIGFCERDHLTSKCYSAIHNTDISLNFRDVLSINPSELQDFDLLTFSPPCQDISTIGLHAGTASGTRTGLMWACIGIIREKKPKYLVMENVKTLALNGKYGAAMTEFMGVLGSLGYDCQAKVLQANRYGIPQIRRRLFMVGKRRDVPGTFSWPNPVELKKQLKDIIDPGEPIKTIDKKIAYTIRLGGRNSGVNDRHNWDGYMINGKEYFLSAKDCLLLMGFSSDDYDALKKNGISESKISKVAGNSVVVTILEHIFKRLLSSAEDSNEHVLFDLAQDSSLFESK